MKQAKTEDVNTEVINWEENNIRSSIQEVVAYIRSAGYFTKVRFYNSTVFGKSDGMEILGSKELEDFFSTSLEHPKYPPVRIWATNSDILGNQKSFEIICPPDPNLNQLEKITLAAFYKIFKPVKEDK